MDGILPFRKGKRGHLNHFFFFPFPLSFISTVSKMLSLLEIVHVSSEHWFCAPEKIIPGHHDATVLSNFSTLLGKKELYSHTKTLFGVVFSKAVSKFSSSSQFVGPQVPETFPNHVSGAELYQPFK